MSQEQKIISELEKHFDRDEFKNGLKSAEKYLKNNPKSAPVTAFKSLFLLKTDEKAKAAETIMSALRLDIKNPTVWKINGQINKELGEYQKALQSYTQAYRGKPDDVTVVAELCSLSLFYENYKQFLEYCRVLIQLNQQPSNIVKYVVALALLHRYEDALSFVEIFEKNLIVSNSTEEAVFRDQFARFHVHLLILSEKYQECLDYLDLQHLITDRISVLESRATCYEKMNNKEKLFEITHELLKEYPDNGDYFAILERNLDQAKYLEELYKIKEEIKSKYAHVRILEIIPTSDEKFRPLLEEHMIPLLKKGSPAIYATIADFTDEKLEIALDIAKKTEIPLSSIPTLHVFIAQVFQHREKYEDSIAECDLGIKQNPTVVELYVTKIQSLSKAGRTTEALECAKILSELDPADRNSNNLYVRCLYRAGQAKTARLTAEPFSIDHEKKSKLFKNEFNKIHLHASRSHLRGGDLKNALVFAEDVIAHFDSYRNGQLNLNFWGGRRAMSFFEMINWSQGLVNHKQLGKAFAVVSRLLLADKNNSELKQFAQKMNKTHNEESMAYLAVIYAILGEPILSLKFYLKLSGHWLLMANPVVKALLPKLGSEIKEDVAKEVFNELFKIKEASPTTAVDYLYHARGLLYSGDIEGAKKALMQAAALEMKFATAVDINLCARFEMKDDNFAKDVRAKINEKYPKYEIENKSFEADDPHDCVSKKVEK